MPSRTLHSLILEFHRIQDSETQDLYTHIAQLELELNHSMSVAQTSQNTLGFETAKACQLALLVLSANTHYTPSLEF